MRPWPVILGAVLLAAAVRLVPWPAVFTPDGVAFVADGDPYYHALRARILAREHRVLWRDPGLDHPNGADVPWPPLLEALVAAPAWVAAGASPPDATVDTSAALVPVALGCLGVVTGALAGAALLGPGGAAATALGLAVLPAGVAYGVVGRPDQHVLEALLLALVLLVLARGATAPAGDRVRAGAALALGAVVTTAFWTWLGSALHVAVACAVAVALHVLAPGTIARRVATLCAVGLAAAAALTALTVALLGPPGALGRMTLGGVSAFPVAVAAGGAALCAALAGAARRAPGAAPARRAAEAAVATAAVAGALLLASPAIRDAVSRGLAAAGGGGTWYASIREFAPLLSLDAALAPQLRAAFEAYGLFPLLALAALPALRAAWRAGPEARAGAVVLGTVAAVFGILAVAVARFEYYAALPLALLAALGLAEAARAASRLGRAAVPAVALAAGASTLPGLLALPTPAPRLEAMARAVAPLADPALPRGAVLARWDAGHHVRWASGRPVIASPFGTEAGPASLADAAAFFLAEDPAAAAALLARRGVRYIALDDPANAALEAAALLGSRRPPVTRAGDPLRGFRIHCEPSYDRLVAARLYYQAGASTPEDPAALGGFRLVGDTGTPEAPLRVFEVVPGAAVEVEGARPGARVEARADVASAVGTFPWESWAVAGEDGRALLRLPFSTGRNGDVRVSAWRVADGAGAAVLSLSEEQVRGGAAVPVSLAAPPGAGAAVTGRATGSRRRE